jgi:hypothetical protein
MVLDYVQDPETLKRSQCLARSHAGEVPSEGLAGEELGVLNLVGEQCVTHSVQPPISVTVI